MGPVRRTFVACRSLIWLSSWIVPAERRNGWRDTRTKQVWHWCQFLAETGRLDRNKKLELARFCWCSFSAALWQRFDREEFLRRREQLRRSPAACLTAIGLVIVVLGLVGGAVGTLRSILSTPIQRPDRVCVISLAGKFRRVRSETLLDLAAAWRSSKLLAAVAPYSWGPSKLVGSHRIVPVLSAKVAPEFFQVLQLNAAKGRTFRAGDDEACSTCMILSDEIWRLQFHADPSVIGRKVTLDGLERTVIGVLPRNFQLLSPEIAAWVLLDSNSPPFSNFVERIGAVARMMPGAPRRKVESDLVDLTENAGYVFPASMLTVTSGTEEIRRYAVSYLLFAILAVACATLTVYARSGSAIGRAPLTSRDRLRWWSFFVVKAVLLLVLAGLLAWTTVRWLSVYLFGSIHPMASGIALWFFLVLSVAPLSWAVYDQQRRCRVCLCRLGTPIQIGAPGHVLLDWSGTEMVCPAGHGVLYLPDSQANWLERDRWDNLDESWAGLFRESRSSS
jgi:hypothetical protein